MKRAIMTKLLLPCIIQQEATPDGFYEVTVEVHDVILATQVIGPGGDTAAMLLQLFQALQRKC